MRAACSALLQPRGLRDLTLFDCDLNAGHLRSLFPPAYAPPLARLSLESNALTAAAVEGLAAWPGLAAVRVLNLNGTQIGDRGLEGLVSSPHLGGLRELNLGQCGLTSRRVRALAVAALGGLERLDISHNDVITEAGLMALCHSSTLPALRSLSHTRFGIPARTVKALQTRFPGRW